MLSCFGQEDVCSHSCSSAFKSHFIVDAKVVPLAGHICLCPGHCIWRGITKLVILFGDAGFSGDWGASVVRVPYYCCSLVWTEVSFLLVDPTVPHVAPGRTLTWDAHTVCGLTGLWGPHSHAHIPVVGIFHTSVVIPRGLPARSVCNLALYSNCCCEYRITF